MLTATTRYTAMPEAGDYRLVPLAQLPTTDGKLPKYPYVLIDEIDWRASTANEQEGLPAFAAAIRNGLGTEVVYVRELDNEEERDL